MTNRTLSRIGAAALAGLLTVGPVAGAVALAPAAAADAPAVVAVEEGSGEIQPISEETGIAPISEDTGIAPISEDTGTESEEEISPLTTVLLVGAMALSSLASIGIAGFLLFRKRPVRNQAA